MNVIRYIGIVIIAGFLLIMGYAIGKKSAIISPLKENKNVENEDIQQRLLNEINGDLGFIKSFDFEISYAKGIGTTTPDNRYYTGMGCIEGKNSMSTPSNIIYTINAKQVSNDKLSYDEDFDLGTCMLDPKNVTFIKPITAGYEVEVAIPNTHFTATYTFIYKNFELQEIYGKVSYYEKNPKSDYEAAGGSLDEYETYITYVKVRDRK